LGLRLVRPIRGAAEGTEEGADPFPDALEVARVASPSAGVEGVDRFLVSFEPVPAPAAAAAVVPLTLPSTSVVGRITAETAADAEACVPLGRRPGRFLADESDAAFAPVVMGAADAALE